MRRYDLIAKICDCMLTLGWGPYQNDHEDANGQFEMNWTYSDALTTADRHAFFKYMVKTLAESRRPARHLHAQAVPRPVRQRLPRARVASGTARPDQNLFRDRRRRARVCRAPPTSSSVGCLHHAEAAVRDHQPHGQFVQADQRRADHVRRDLVAQHHQLHAATTART